VALDDRRGSRSTFRVGALPRPSAGAERPAATPSPMASNRQQRSADARFDCAASRRVVNSPRLSDTACTRIRTSPARGCGTRAAQPSAAGRVRLRPPATSRSSRAGALNRWKGSRRPRSARAWGDAVATPSNVNTGSNRLEVASRQHGFLPAVVKRQPPRRRTAVRRPAGIRGATPTDDMINAVRGTVRRRITPEFVIG
jgi:hypothetical protein